MEDAFALRVLQLAAPDQIRAELERVGADSSVATALDEQQARAEFHIVKLEHASLALARLLYQELVMEGGQVVTPPRLEHVGEGETAVLLCATRYQFAHLLVRLRWQPSEELQLLADELERALERFVSPPPALDLGGTRFAWGSRTHIMGILNITPNSFSGDGLIQAGDTMEDTTARVLARAHQLIEEGADILDIGGESTHPRAEPIDADTELARVLPIVQAMTKEFRVPLSIDTRKASVAHAALDAGASMINDVTGLRGASDMARVIAEHHAAVVITHNGTSDAQDTLGAILRDLRGQIQLAQSAGIPALHILIDPGLGFGKSPTQNLEILNRLGELRVLGYPILIGPSRKGFISKTIDVPVEEREEGTAAAISVGILRGANIVRVHDVKAMTRVARMTDAILHSQSNLKP